VAARLVSDISVPSTPSVFAPVSTPAFAIRELSFLVLAIVTVIFVVVSALTTDFDFNKEMASRDNPRRAA
jgi:hypothetical protein